MGVVASRRARSLSDTVMRRDASGLLAAAVAGCLLFSRAVFAQEPAAWPSADVAARQLSAVGHGGNRKVAHAALKSTEERAVVRTAVDRLRKKHKSKARMTDRGVAARLARSASLPAEASVMEPVLGSSEGNGYLVQLVGGCCSDMRMLALSSLC